MTTTAPHDVGAMLADGLRGLVAGFASAEGGLGAPSAPTARMPQYDGGPPPRRLPRVALQGMAASRPYYRLSLVVLGPGAGDRVVQSPADFKGLRVVAPVGTLADTLLRAWYGGTLTADLVTLDATPVELGGFDAYRAAADAGTIPRRVAPRPQPPRLLRRPLGRQASVLRQPL